MQARKIGEGVWWVGAVDWDRRLFDNLIPLPDGTSYNAYFVQGTVKSALIDYRRSCHETRAYSKG